MIRRVAQSLTSPAFTFLATAVFLLLLGTGQFRGDLPALVWSLVVLAGVVYFAEWAERQGAPDDGAGATGAAADD